MRRIYAAAILLMVAVLLDGAVPPLRGCDALHAERTALMSQAEALSTQSALYRAMSSSHDAMPPSEAHEANLTRRLLLLDGQRLLRGC